MRLGGSYHAVSYLCLMRMWPIVSLDTVKALGPIVKLVSVSWDPCRIMDLECTCKEASTHWSERQLNFRVADSLLGIQRALAYLQEQFFEQLSKDRSHSGQPVSSTSPHGLYICCELQRKESIYRCLLPLELMFIPCLILQEKAYVSSTRCLQQGEAERECGCACVSMKLNKSHDTEPMRTHKFQEGQFQRGMRIAVADILEEQNTESCANWEKYNFPALSWPFLNCLPGCIHQLASPGPSFLLVYIFI